MLNKSIETIENYDIKSSGILNYHVLEGIADLVRVVDRQGKIIYANRSMKKELGENIVGMDCNEAHCQLERCNFCITEKSISTGEVFQKEEYLNGNYYSIKSSPVKDNNGKIFAAVEVFRNISREKKLEKELINKNSKMSDDLKFAKKIQEKLLPEKNLKSAVKLEYIYRASEMLSGDMFDMFKIDDEHYGIYISDVAGNGVAASMMTMFIRQTMRVMEDSLLSPSKTLERLHCRFKNLNLDVEHYFTLFYGIYNKKTRILTYSNAGHNCFPIIYNKERLDVLESRGFPIMSILEDVNYLEKEVHLDQGDKILFYTDGVTECRNSLGKEFGIEGVVNIVRERPDHILKRVEQEIMDYSWGEQEDDIAIVLLTIEE